MVLLKRRLAISASVFYDNCSCLAAQWGLSVEATLPSLHLHWRSQEINTFLLGGLIDVTAFPVAIERETGPWRILWVLYSLDYSCCRDNLRSGHRAAQLIKEKTLGTSTLRHLDYRKRGHLFHAHEYSDKMTPCIARAAPSESKKENQIVARMMTRTNTTLWQTVANIHSESNNYLDFYWSNEIHQGIYFI